MIQRVLVLGAGSAGLLAALSLRVRHPHLKLQVLRSPELGIIGVGEGTTRYLLSHLHGYLHIDLAEFYREVQPIWKLGVHFLWGPRPSFNYSFNYQFALQHSGFNRSHGFYAFEDCTRAEISSALMSADRVFVRQPDGVPLIRDDLGYHLENATFVNYLERLAVAIGVEIVDGTVRDVEANDSGITKLHLEDGRMLDADLYIDCSGFRSLLLGKTLAEPFEDYGATLFCDRAVVGGWQRQPHEPIKPYTTAETMQAGWAWQIEHEHRVNRGYVYSSSFVTDEEAEDEFRQANPSLTQTRVVRFKTGRYRRSWVKNVVAIGNSSGFVEPLEATALGVIAQDCQALCSSLVECNFVPTPSIVREYNERGRRMWEAIRNFLSIHYRFNRRLDTPFWRECREKVDLAGAERIVDYYRENGPGTAYKEVLIDSFDQFGLDGYLVLLIGQQVPHANNYVPSAAERDLWQQKQREHAQQATQAFTTEEALEMIRSPYWTWRQDFYRDVPS